MLGPSVDRIGELRASLAGGLDWSLTPALREQGPECKLPFWAEGVTWSRWASDHLRQNQSAAEGFYQNSGLSRCTGIWLYLANQLTSLISTKRAVALCCQLIIIYQETFTQITLLVAQVATQKYTSHCTNLP